MTNQSSENLLNLPIEIATDNGYKFSWFDWFCLWYPPGWLILFNRHWQHYHQDPEGWNWLEYILFLLPGGFYLALLIRWLRLGCRAPKQEIDEFNPEYQKAFSKEVLAPIVKYYFQGELKQLENLPLSPLMLLLILFPSMGVWAMKTRLRYFIQPLEPLSTTDKFANPHTKRTNLYQQAQKLREKLQVQINQLLNHQPS